MSASKRKKNDLVTNRFKLEPLSPRVLYSADVQWLSGVHGFQSWTLHDDAQPQYLNSTPAPLVQFAANQPRHETTADAVGTVTSDVTEKNALLKERAVVIQPSSDNAITAEQWLNLIKEKLAAQDTVDVLYLPVNANGNFQLTQDTEMSPVDVLVNAQSISSWQDHFSENARIVTYVAEHDASSTDTAVTRTSNQLSASERSLQTLTGVNILNAETPQTEEASSTFSPTRRDGSGAIFSVTNLNSSGVGSFRQAIIDANNDTGPAPALIKFDVAGTINVSTTLPRVTGSTHIDAYYGTNEVSGARIILNKNFGSGDALTIFSGDNSFIQGIAIVNAGADGLQIDNSDGVIIRNSYFGTDGDSLSGNRGSGITINTSRNITIENNVISGNRLNGITITGVNDGNADNIFIYNNMIGLNESGDTKLGNGFSGVWLRNVNTVYIGLDDDLGNYIADNNNYGILVNNFENVTIGGNVIGVTADNQAAGNARSNVYVITGGSDLTIGSGVTLGSIDSTGNVISNSGASGIEFPSASGVAFFNSVRIAGNYIGTDITGNVAMGNSQWGIRVLSTVSDVVIGAPEAGGGNVISANGNSGIVLSGGPNSNIAIDNNHIGVSADGLIELGNGGYGIDNIHNGAGLTGMVIGSEKTIVNGNPVPGHNGNLFAGNSDGEIRLVGGQDIEILSNTFGELVDGSQAANSNTAIEVLNEASGLIIGGSAAGGNTFGNYRTGTNLDNADGVGGRITHNRFGSQQANVDNIFGVYIGSSVSDVFIGLNQFYFTQNVAVHLSSSTQGATVFNNRYYGVPNPFTNFSSTSSTNNGIDAPTLEAASRTGSGGLNISGVFDGVANTSYRVEFILLEENIGDGSFVVGAGTYQTDSTGAGEIDLTINNFVRDGEIIASITRDDSVTGLAESSEYSGALVLDPLPASTPIGLVDDIDNAVNSVDEEMPIGTVVGITAEAKDLDASDTVTYSLSDDAGGRFAIDPSRGVVSTAQIFDLETDATDVYDITVLASSSDTTTEESTFTVTVNDVNEFGITTVIDINSNVYLVPSTVAVGTDVILEGYVTDRDASDDLTYSFTSDGSGGRFSIDTNTGVVSTMTSLANDVGGVYPINIKAISDDGSLKIYNVTMEITPGVGPPEDINSDPNSVPETSPIGTFVGITAEDPNNSASVTYSLLDDAGGRFAIDAMSGEVSTVDVFDVETDASTAYDIIVLASSIDGSEASSTFSILIEDVNEFTPQMFPETFDVSEGIASGALIGPLAGDDEDNNATLQNYTIVSGNNDSLFQVDSITGELSLSPGATLDAETQTQHILMVSVSDGTNVSQTAPITINVADVNDNSVTRPTDLDPSANTVDASASVGTPIGITAFAQDADTSDGVRYSLTGPSSGLFTINATNGEVTTALPLEAEAGTFLALTIEATSDDSSIASSVHTVSITAPIGPLTDDNSAGNTVFEGNPIGTEVGITALAVDVDINDTVSYGLMNSTGVPFAIDPSTGVVTTTQIFDVETDASTEYDITVVAESTDGTRALRTFTINVLNVNEFTPDVDSQNLTIVENTQSGIAIATVTATDDDANSALQQYTIVSGNNDSLFQINSNNGQLSVVPGAAIDAETEQQHILMVTVSDGNNVSTATPITINVADVNEHSVSTPVDGNSTGNTVAPDAVVGTSVGITAIAEDLDVSDGVLYSLTNNANGRFSIDSQTGEVSVASSLLSDAGTVQSIVVEATSGDGSTSSQNLSVTVTGSISSLSDSNAAANSVNEGLLAGASVGIRASASDPDASDSITYSLSDDADGRFAIDDTTGLVTTLMAFDAETDTAFDITAVAESDDGTFSSQSFTVTIVDVNEFAPSINAQTLTISEDTPPITELAELQATDGDSSFVAEQWTITSGNEEGVFQINPANGKLFLGSGNQLDAETTQQYVLFVSVSDGTNVSLPTPITINITDADEFDVSTPIDLDGSINKVEFDAPLASSIGFTAFAQDADINDSVSYALSNDANGRFVINPLTGEVSTAASLSADSGSQLSFTVEATSTDGSTSSLTASVMVTGPIGALIDVDSNANSVNEGSPVGTSVGVIAQAADPDINDTVSYSLSNDAAGRFSIDSNTGVVVTTETFDAEIDSEYAITVLAESSDGSSSSQLFTIAVTDVNEFVPEVLAQVITVSESSPALTEIGQLQASDNDITYTPEQWTINSGNADGVFQINSDNGRLFIAPGAQLDAETDQQHVLFVSVFDGDNVSAPVPIVVNVSDENENSVSALVDSDVTANIVASNAPAGTPIGFTALAEDSDVNDNVTYSLIDDGNGRFSINQITGEVSKASSVAADAGTTQLFTVEATSSDGSKSLLTDSVNVTGPTGQVMDVDSSINTVDATAPIGSPVGITANATDPDASDSITYSLLNNLGGTFSIDPVSGVITTAGPLEAYAGTQQNLFIEATSSDGSTDIGSFTVEVTAPISAISDSDSDVNGIDEGLPAGSNVGITVQAIDPDTSDLVTYSLIDDADGRFAIDPVSGVVTTTTPLSVESATTWDIEAVATSSDGSSESQAFTISIADVNEFSVSEIVDFDSAENEVAESIAIGSSVGITANAVDTDLSDSVSYSIDDEEQSSFSIDSATGEVSTNAALDFEEQTNHQVIVTATSSDGSTSTSVFTVNVLNVNEYKPVVITDNISLDENTSTSVIASLNASDADGLTSFTDWRIESGNESNLFLLDEATGELSIAPGVVIDHETADEYELLVSVSDGISRSEPTLITITIEDQNEAPIFEGAEFNTTTDFIGSIGQLEVTDPDTGDTHTFTIQSADSAELFLSPNGLLFQQDLLEQGAIEVPVQVVDAAGASANGIILLNVVETAPQPLLGEAMPLMETVTIQPTLEVADSLSVSELLSTNANNQSDSANEAPVEQEMVAAPEASTPSISSSAAASEEFVEVVEDSLFETNESSAEINNSISDDNFNSADPFSRFNGNPAGALRLDPIDLRLNNNLNDPLTGLSIGELGGNRRIVMNILVSADQESSVELNSLSNVFVNQYVGSAFSPQLINALQGVSDELENEAAAEQKQEDLRVTTTTFVSSVLTVGFVTWLLQSGSLVATAMTTAPLWQGLDPIPVLANSDSDSDSEF